MKITERKKIVKEVIENVIIGRKCDICKREITPNPLNFSSKEYNYFLITTHHNDWGNDSCDSYEEYDACSPECVMAFTSKYVAEAYDKVYNTEIIEIEHIRTLEEGAD